MGINNFHFKFKVFRLRRFRVGDGRSKKKEAQTTKRKPIWMMPISHGYHVVEDHDLSFRKNHGGSIEAKPGPVVGQREQIGDIEVWFFGVFDCLIGDGITKYIQTHLFDKFPKESHLMKKSKDVLKKAYISARGKAKEAQKGDEQAYKLGSASLMVINGEKLVMANMGDYRAVLSRDGLAHQISHGKLYPSQKRHWSRRLFSSRILVCDSGDAEARGQSRNSELVVATKRVDWGTEFVVIASSGLWKVMNNQEAVSLIRHMEDAQEAAECLTKEASARMSKSSISCIVIRFD